MAAGTASLTRAARVLRSGGVVAYPTESVYGLGCNPLDPDAVLRILEMKDRSPRAGLILISDSLERLEPFIEPAAGERRRLAEAGPGPVTWAVSVAPGVPAWLTGGRPTIAVRVTAFAPAAALCREAGFPLVSTSANRGGRPPARSAVQVRRWLGDDVDYVLGGRTGGRPRPSEIRLAASGEVLRAG